MPASLDSLPHLRLESDRFGDCLSDADPTAPVPSCPEWTAADLLWHVTEVQHFWGTIARERLDEPDQAENSKPRRPADYAELLELFRRVSADLHHTLTTTPPEVSVWTWSDDHSIGFLRRRQAHEALIHRLDAELTVGSVTEFDPLLAADGVDEALTLMYGGAPGWATVTPSANTGRVSATDVPVEWDFTIGRFIGTSPNSGTSYNEPTLLISPERLPEQGFTVRGSARDLDAWLWNRPPLAELDVLGDLDAYAQFKAVVAKGVQ